MKDAAVRAEMRKHVIDDDFRLWSSLEAYQLESSAAHWR